MCHAFATCSQWHPAHTADAMPPSLSHRITCSCLHCSSFKLLHQVLPQCSPPNYMGCHLASVFYCLALKPLSRILGFFIMAEHLEYQLFKCVRWGYTVITQRILRCLHQQRFISCPRYMQAVVLPHIFTLGSFAILRAAIVEADWESFCS